MEHKCFYDPEITGGPLFRNSAGLVLKMEVGKPYYILDDFEPDKMYDDDDDDQGKEIEWDGIDGDEPNERESY